MKIKVVTERDSNTLLSIKPNSWVDGKGMLFNDKNVSEQLTSLIHGCLLDQIISVAVTENSVLISVYFDGEEAMLENNGKPYTIFNKFTVLNKDWWTCDITTDGDFEICKGCGLAKDICECGDESEGEEPYRDFAVSEFLEFWMQSVGFRNKKFLYLDFILDEDEEEIIETDKISLSKLKRNRHDVKTYDEIELEREQDLFRKEEEDESETEQLWRTVRYQKDEINALKNENDDLMQFIDSKQLMDEYCESVNPDYVLEKKEYIEDLQ